MKMLVLAITALLLAPAKTAVAQTVEVNANFSEDSYLACDSTDGAFKAYLMRHSSTQFYGDGKGSKSRRNIWCGRVKVVAPKEVRRIEEVSLYGVKLTVLQMKLNGKRYFVAMPNVDL